MKAKDAILPAVMFGGLAGYAWASLPPAVFQSSDQRARIEQSVTYAGCNEVRAAGKAPIRAGEPGYRPEMDGDGDGLACEPHRLSDAARVSPASRRSSVRRNSTSNNRALDGPYRGRARNCCPTTPSVR